MTTFDPDPQGVRKDYSCEPKPLGEGGYAEVFSATHKPTGTVVALKRLHNVKSVLTTDALPRMKREVEVLRSLHDSPHVMAVYDCADDFSWYVMPKARGDLFTLYEDLGIGEEGLVRVLRHAADGLKAAHNGGYVHRDVTPRNLLLLDEPDAPWVVADWGLVRKPVGMTTTLLTSRGDVIGTDGFLAPEVFDDAHNVTTAADVYSLGRVITWAVRGRIPLRGERTPPPGAFRQLVRASTQDDPSARPSLAEFVAELDQLMFDAPPTPSQTWDEILGQVQAGDEQAARKLAEAADERPDDGDLYLDYVAKGGTTLARQAVALDPEMATRLVERMASHMGSSFGYRSFDYLNTPLDWIHEVAQAAEAAGKLGLLEDVSLALFKAEAANVRFAQRERTRAWLDKLSGQAALAVARALRATPEACEWFGEGEWVPSSRADLAIRNVMLQATSSI